MLQQFHQVGGDGGIIIGKTFNLGDFTGANGPIMGTAGDDVINITGTMSGGTINTDDGNDTITIEKLSGGTITLGQGADNITIDSVGAGATIDFGDDTDADIVTFGTIDEAFLGGDFTLTLKNFKIGDKIDFGGTSGITGELGDGDTETIVFGDRSNPNALRFTLDLGVFLTSDQGIALDTALANGGVFTL